MDNKVLSFESGLGKNPKHVGLSQMMWVFGSFFLVAIALVSAEYLQFHMPIDKTAVVMVTEMNKIPGHKTSRIRVGGKYAETEKSIVADEYEIGFVLNSNRKTMFVDKDVFDNVKVGGHIEVAYRIGVLFPNQELVSASILK